MSDTHSPRSGVVRGAPGHVCLLVALLSGSLPAAARAQEPRTPAGFQRSDPTIDGVRAQLASGQPIAVAWGARDAATRGWRELGPDLREALRTLGARARAPNEAQNQARDALLDALTRLRVPLADDDLAHWGHVDHLRPALIALAALDPEACSSWLRSVVALSTGSAPFTDDWSSAASLLARAAPRAAAPLLVGRARPQLRIVVRERWVLPLENDPARDVGLRCGNDRARRPVRTALDGFPALVSYAWSRSPDERVQSVVEAPLPFGILRAEAASFPVGRSQDLDLHQRAEDALRILAWLVRDDPPAEIGLLSAEPEIALGWSTPERFAEEATTRCARMEARWRALVDALARRGLVAADVASAEARPLAVTVEDGRRDRAQPLPPLPVR